MPECNLLDSLLDKITGGLQRFTDTVLLVYWMIYMALISVRCSTGLWKMVDYW